MANVVVIANRALGDRALVEWMLRRDQLGVVEFRIVVPVRVPGPADFAGGMVGFVPLEGLHATDYVAEARGRLSVVLDELRLCGVMASGSVHAGEAIHVLDDALDGWRVDEFAVAPAANAMSRLLGIDLARRLRRRWAVPVCEIELRPRRAAA